MLFEVKSLRTLYLLVSGSIGWLECHNFLVGAKLHSTYSCISVLHNGGLFEFKGCSIILTQLYVRGDRAINIGHPLPEMPE